MHYFKSLLSRGLAGLAAAIALALPALAADGAQVRAIGYSPDGRYFAYEQFGVGDTSGFPYWDVMVIDLATGQPAEKFPVHAVVEDETEKLKDARKEAMETAWPLVTALGANAEPAQLLAANPFTEVTPDRRHIAFDLAYDSTGEAITGKEDGSYELDLKQTDLPQPAECKDAREKAHGLTLTITARKLATPAQVIILTDTSIPASRNCPLSYDIEAVYGPMNLSSDSRPVALIGVYTRGFHGLDRRFIAIPFDPPR